EHSLLQGVLQPTEGKLLSIEQVEKVVSIWTGCSIEDAALWVKLPTKRFTTRLYSCFSISGRPSS
ncbi:hypothetical protein, partial [Bacillus cereus]